MNLTRNPIMRLAGAGLLVLLLTAVPALGARYGRGGYRGGYSGYYPGYYSGVYGRGFGIGVGAPYYNYGNYAPSSGYYSPSTVIVPSDVTMTQSGYYTPAAPDNRAHIEVRVPADAQVLFDGAPTQQTGEDRRFVTPPLDSSGTYTVQAKWMENGRKVDQTKTVKVGPGASEMVDFTR
jgi:uncharacterized protein (TIGR03000 family)